MNPSVIRALLHEQFQRTFKIFVLCLGITGIFSALALWDYLRLPIPREDDLLSAIDVAASGIVLSEIFAILALLYIYSDDRDLRVNLPSYLLRLPVRTATLVFWRLGYSVAFMATLGFLASACVYILFSGQLGPDKSMDELLPFWLPLQSGVTIFVLLQALAWFIGGSGAAVTAVFSALLIFAAYYREELIGSFFDPEFYETPAAPAVVLASAFLCWVAVTLRRNGMLDLTNALSALLPKRAGRQDDELLPFKSPEAAMRWLEWRRIGWHFPLVIVLLTLAITAYAVNHSPVPTLQWSEETVRAYYGNTVAICFYMALGLGVIFFGVYTLFQNQRLQLGPQKTFLYMRPVPTRTLAATRIEVALKAVLLGGIPFAIAATVALYLAIQTQEFDLKSMYERFTVPQALGIYALLGIGYFGAIWCALWTGNGLTLLLIYALPMIFFQAVPAFDDWPSHRMFTYATAITAALAIPTTIYLFVRAHRMHVLDVRALGYALVALPIILAGFLMYGNWTNLETGNPIYFFAEREIVLAVAVLPILPFATIPLIMHYTRHR